MYTLGFKWGGEWGVWEWGGTRGGSSTSSSCQTIHNQLPAAERPSQAFSRFGLTDILLCSSHSKHTILATSEVGRGSGSGSVGARVPMSIPLIVCRTLGVLHRVLGVLHRFLGALHRVLRVLHRALVVMQRVLQVLGVIHP